MAKSILIGSVYERLTIIGAAEPSPAGVQRVLCRCSCGKETRVMVSNLRAGKTKSCGCLSREKAPFKHRTHGHTQGQRRLPEYGVWNTMKSRCTNPKAAKFAEYGGRGITVCERWLHSFENFLLDMGKRPSPQHTIDRINNNGNYEPGNCQWSVQRTQQQNRRDNTLVTFQGETLCLSEWTRRFNLPVGLVSQRLKRLGWSVEKALTTPSQALRWFKRKR